jgi:hypothetical protein
VTSSSTRRIKLAAAILTTFVMLASFSFAGSGASPTATHTYPAPVKTGEPIAINLTIDPHNTILLDVIVDWWTSLSETHTQVNLIHSTNISIWGGEIPAQSRPCEIYYRIWIDYLDANNDGSMSPSRLILPSENGNYLVSVKGELFGDLSPWAVAIGISLMILAVGVIFYAQRLVARMDPHYEDSVKARKEKVDIPKEEIDDHSNMQQEGEDKSKGAPPSS